MKRTELLLLRDFLSVSVMIHNSETGTRAIGSCSLSPLTLMSIIVSQRELWECLLKLIVLPKDLHLGLGCDSVGRMLM